MRATDPRLSLLRAAEKLFTERGIDRVSLREIAAAAGQRNHSAAQYHFENKRELVEALLERHCATVQASWPTTLATLAARKSGVGDVVELLVRTVVAKLDDPDGGRAYLEISAQLVGHPQMPLTSMRVAKSPEAIQLARHMRELTPISAALFPLHVRRIVGALHHSIVDYARLREAKQVRASRETFTLDLISALTGLVNAGGAKPAKTRKPSRRRKSSATTAPQPAQRQKKK
jgi:AcrR family transcriptional regulator